MGQLPNVLYLASIWVIPVVIAVTFHEAAHGFVARFLGDDTAWKLGRVSLNPIKHIDPLGTILLPGFLLYGAVDGVSRACDHVRGDAEIDSQLRTQHRQNEEETNQN